MSTVAHKQAAKHAAKQTAKQALKKKCSAAQPAGKPIAPCPLKCNLKMLKINEPKAGTSEKKMSRAAEIVPRAALKPQASPTLIPTGGKFQITANSRLTNEPRELKYSVVTEATCPGSKHPVLTWRDSKESKMLVGTSGEGKFFPAALACDRSLVFFSFFNAVFATGARQDFLVCNQLWAPRCRQRRSCAATGGIDRGISWGPV